MGSDRESTRNYIDKIEGDMLDLKGQLATALTAQGLAEVRAATAEAKFSEVERRANSAEARVSEIEQISESLRVSVLSADVRVAAAEAKALAIENAANQDRVSKVDSANKARIEAEAKAFVLAAELRKQVSSTPETAYELVVSERDGNERTRKMLIMPVRK